MIRIIIGVYTKLELTLNSRNFAMMGIKKLS